MAGYQMHMAKPIEPQELVATVASFAGRLVRPPGDRSRGRRSAREVTRAPSIVRQLEDGCSIDGPAYDSCRNRSLTSTRAQGEFSHAFTDRCHPRGDRRRHPAASRRTRPTVRRRPSSVEDIYIARSWRESRVEPTPYCDAARTGFAGSIMEDRYTFHSVATRTSDGLITDADAGTIGELHACFGPLPDDAASFNFYAEGKLDGVTFTGRGNCLSTRENYPEPGVSGFRCYLDLTDLPPEYVGGQLATNTIVRALTAPAGTPDPPGYVQQSIATVRLWKRRDASGAAAYTKYCASCHDQVGARIPTRDALAEMSPARILRTLDFGLMMSIAYPMKRDEREAVAAFLGKGRDDAAPPSARCAPDIRIMAGAAQASWAGWGPSQDNARYQTAERAGLGAADIPRLELKWAYGFSGDIIAFAAPTVVNGTLFVGSAGGAVQALDAQDRLSALALSGERPRAHGDDGGNGRRGQDAALQRPERRRLRRGCRERQAPLANASRAARGHALDRLVRRARRRGLHPSRFVGRNARARSGVSVLHVPRQRDRGSRSRRLGRLEDLSRRPAADDGPDRGRDADVRPVGRRHLVDADDRRAPRLAVRHDRRQLLAPGRLRRAMPSSRSRSRPAVSRGRSKRRRTTSTTRRAAAAARTVPRTPDPITTSAPRRCWCARRTARTSSSRARNPASCTRSIRPTAANRCGRPASAKAEPTAASNGAPQATAATCMRQSRTSCACRT